MRQRTVAEAGIHCRAVLIGAFALCPFATGALAEDAAPPIAHKAQVCFACHGPNGASTNEKYPVLAGQQQYYLYLQLKDFKAGRRQNAEMEPIMATLAPEDLLPLAEYFSQQQWPSLNFQLDPVKIK